MQGIVDFPVYLHPIVVGALLSYITIEILTASGKVSDEEHALRESLHEIPAAEIDAGRLRGTLLCSKVVIAVGVLFAALLLVFYARPYQDATGGGATGEYLLAIGIGLSLVLTGVLALWGTKRSYHSG